MKRKPYALLFTRLRETSPDAFPPPRPSPHAGLRDEAPDEPADLWDQIDHAEAASSSDTSGKVFRYNRRRIIVPLGVYSITTDSEGRAVVTLPPEMQLGLDESFEINPVARFSSLVAPEEGGGGPPLAAFVEWQDNTAFSILTLDPTGAPSPGVHIQVIVEDHGRDGTYSVVTI